MQLNERQIVIQINNKIRICECHTPTIASGSKPHSNSVIFSFLRAFFSTETGCDSDVSVLLPLAFRLRSAVLPKFCWIINKLAHNNSVTDGHDVLCREIMHLSATYRHVFVCVFCCELSQNLQSNPDSSKAVWAPTNFQSSCNLSILGSIQPERNTNTNKRMKHCVPNITKYKK